MLSDEEKEKLEQARSNITRGVDIESAMLILEKCALDGLIFTGGRVNIFKTAVRQILNFLKEYKDKGYLDVVREKVKANQTIEKQSKEIEEYKKQLDLDYVDKHFVPIERYNQLKKEIEELKKDKLELINKNYVVHLKDVEKELREMRKVIDTKNAEIECLNVIHESYKEMVEENNFISKDKIKAKIEEVEQWELYNMKIPKLSTLDERLGAKIGIKYFLQSLLEKE